MKKAFLILVLFCVGLFAFAKSYDTLQEVMQFTDVNCDYVTEYATESENQFAIEYEGYFFVYISGRIIVFKKPEVKERKLNKDFIINLSYGSCLPEGCKLYK